MKRITSLLLSAVLCLSITGAYASVFAESDTIAFKENSKQIIDSDSGYISRIPFGMTKTELLDKLVSAEGVTVTKNGEAVADDEPLASGYTVNLGDVSYVCAVSGDTNGDGKINLTDVSTLLKHIAGWETDLHVPAIDVTLDGKDNLSDASQILKYIAGWDVYLGVFDVKYSGDRLTAEHEDKNLSLSVQDNMQKIDYKSNAIGNFPSLCMFLSRNEIESCQVYLASKGGHKDLNISFTQFNNGSGDTIETEMTMHHYVSSESVDDPNKKVYYPDAMIPLAEFDIKDGNSQGFLLKIKPDKDAKPGMYVSKVTVRDANGKAIKVCNIYANVWDLTLPDSSSCATAFGLSYYNIYATHQMFDGDDSQLYINYYEYLLENRISAYYLPYSFEDPRFEDYMYDPRVSSFCVTGCQQGPNDNLSDKELAALYKKYGNNETWNEKAYFYYVDEPSSEPAINELRIAHQRLEEYFPNARHITPILHNPWYGSKDQVEVVAELTNLWCPISCFYTPTQYADDRNFLDRTYSTSLGSASINKYGTAQDRFAAYKAAGDELWWYVCVVPQAPYANFFTNYQGEMSRVLFWQQYMYDIDGCLYWSTNYWNNGAEWRTSDNGFYSGDGLLIYSGHKFGIYGPIGCLRMEYIRDGIEDFEYLTMAEELYGRKEVEKVLSKVTTGILDYSNESSVIDAAKRELAQMIMNAEK